MTGYVDTLALKTSLHGPAFPRNGRGISKKNAETESLRIKESNHEPRKNIEGIISQVKIRCAIVT